MGRRFACFAVLGVLLLTSHYASAQTTGPSTRPVQPVPPVTVPIIQRGTMPRHEAFLAIAKKGDIDLLFLGDSITDFWQRPQGKPVWDKYFASFKVANFGINADRTQNLLWRLQNGELEGFKAKCIVLMIGTNNIGTPEVPRNTIEDAILGVKLVVNEIRQRQPQAKILLLSIFPRGAAKTDAHRPLILQANQAISKLDDGKSIFYVDIYNKFLADDGSMLPEVMIQDQLHPNTKGYEIWASSIIDKVKEIVEAK